MGRYNAEVRRGKEEGSEWRGVCGKIWMPKDALLAGTTLSWNTKQPECQLSDLPSQGIHSTGSNLRHARLTSLARVCIAPLPKAAGWFWARRDGCCEKTWSPRRSEAPIASSPSLWGTMARVSVTCHVPTLTQELGRLQQKWRLIAAHAPGPVLIDAPGPVLMPQGSGFCSSSRFILGMGGPYITIRRALKIAKWTLGLEVGRWSKAGHSKKRISNYAEYYAEWMK